MTYSDAPGPREPLFNAPWPAVALAVALILCFLGQGFLTDAQFSLLALWPQAVRQGDPVGLFTSLFLHGGWPHVLMNAAFCLAFGAPVARLLGTDGRGALVLAVFYMTCGVLAGLAYVAIHPGGVGPVVGASGAVSGLMGAAARLIDGRRRWGVEVLGPIRSRTVGSLAAAWVVVNLLVAVFGFPGSGGAGIAWEAHLAGFAAGVMLIGPFAKLFRRKAATVDSNLGKDDAPWT
jgi:membrane associated rhomboid family serine protease